MQAIRTLQLIATHERGALSTAIERSIQTMKQTCLTLLAAATLLATLQLAPAPAEAAPRYRGGLSRGWFAVDRSRYLKKSGARKSATNSVAHQMLWGPPGPGFYRGR